MHKKLNLGCGQFKKEGYINLDHNSFVRPDVVHDLHQFPYPFPDNEFDLIEASHVLEHLDHPFSVMKELFRISKSGGEIKIKVPHFSRGHTHPEHTRGFDITFPYYFKPDFMGGYTGIPLQLRSLRLRWFSQEILKKMILGPLIFYPAKFTGYIIDFFANLSPVLCSRIWCFIVGGIEEIEFVFVVNKN